VFLTPEYGSKAAGNPAMGAAGSKGRRWFLVSTPDHLQVPLHREHADKWSKRHLNLDEEKEKLRLHHEPREASSYSLPLKALWIGVLSLSTGMIRPDERNLQAAALWPDDECSEEIKGGARAVMGSHKMHTAKEHSLQLQALADQQVDEYMAEWRLQHSRAEPEESDEVHRERTWRELGMTAMEIQLEQYESAQRSLHKLRSGRPYRPPDFETKHAGMVRCPSSSFAIVPR
jgi:hypothetical protein